MLKVRYFWVIFTVILSLVRTLSTRDGQCFFYKLTKKLVRSSTILLGYNPLR